MNAFVKRNHINFISGTPCKPRQARAVKPEVLKSWSLEIDYSRAPCLGADQKAHGLWERDWSLERLSTAYFFPRERQRGSRDLTFSAFAFSTRGRFSRLETTRKREYLRPIFTDYIVILIACFHSYASFIVKLRVSNSSGKHITSPYPFFLVAVNGD